MCNELRGMNLTSKSRVITGTMKQTISAIMYEEAAAWITVVIYEKDEYRY